MIILRNLVCIDNVFCYAPVKPVIFQYSSISVIATNESELCPGCLCDTYNVLDVLLFWREIKELYFIYDDESDMIEFDPFLYKPFCCRDTLGPNGPSSMVISGIQKSVKCCGNGFKHVSDIFSERCHHDDGDLMYVCLRMQSRHFGDISSGTWKVRSQQKLRNFSCTIHPGI